MKKAVMHEIRAKEGDDLFDKNEEHIVRLRKQIVIRERRLDKQRRQEEEKRARAQAEIAESERKKSKSASYRKPTFTLI